MSSDVTLPNGFVMKNVPDDIGKHELAMAAIKSGVATNKDFGYEEVEQDKATFVEGIGAGMMDTARSVGNMVGLVDDETVMDQREIDKGLGGWGKAGKFAGEMLATAPLGMGVGAGVAKGATALRAGRMLPKYAANTLARGAGRGAVEGATYGAVMADPNKRGSGAAGGAAFGGALGATGTALGKVLGKGKITDITKEAKFVQRNYKTFVPLSQSAEGSITRMVYNALIANMPWASKVVRGQHAQGVDDLAKWAGEFAHPPRSNVHISRSDTFEQMYTKLDDFWNGNVNKGIKGVFDEIDDVSIRMSKNKTPVPDKWLEDMFNSATKGTRRLPQPGEVIKGKDLRNIKTTLGTLDAGTPELNYALREYTKQLHEVARVSMNNPLKGQSLRKSQEVWAKYDDATQYYSAWKALEKAGKAAKASGGEFSMPQLAAQSFEGLAHKSKSEMQHLGEMGAKALPDFPSQEGIFQIGAALGLATGGLGGVLVGGATGGVAAGLTPFVIGLARIGASKNLQRYISGQTKFQRLNKVMMRKYKDELMALGATSRQAAQILGEQDGS